MQKAGSVFFFTNGNGTTKDDIIATVNFKDTHKFKDIGGSSQHKENLTLFQYSNGSLFMRVATDLKENESGRIYKFS